MIEDDTYDAPADSYGSWEVAIAALREEYLRDREAELEKASQDNWRSIGRLTRILVEKLRP